MSSVYFCVHDGPSEQRVAMIKKILNVLYRNVAPDSNSSTLTTKLLMTPVPQLQLRIEPESKDPDWYPKINFYPI